MDATERMLRKPRSLADLNHYFEPTGWQVVRGVGVGYYYFTHPVSAPSEGVYVFNCRELTFGQWQAEFNQKVLSRGN